MNCFYFDKFDNKINQLLKKEKDMGLIELEQQYREEVAEERGLEIGKEIGIKVGETKVQKQNVQNMLKANFEVESIVNLLTVSKAFVLEVKREMKKNGLL